MPFARLSTSQRLPLETAHRLSRDVTDLIATELSKNRELTSVLIEDSSAAIWTIAGESQPSSAHLEVNVTAGTNSLDEKQRFISKAMNLINNYIDGLHSATYVIIREIPASDWGYDGLTQAARREMNSH